MPSRVAPLITKVEEGERLSPADTARALDLMALDVARQDEVFVEESLQRQEKANDDF
jgi:hypothetical protein